jgi:RND superfamily putative drug exporter
MVMLFLAFVLGPDATIKLFGLGLAAAVFLDAIIIRSVLVPGLMLALGKANWYLPTWLDRALPHLAVEGTSHHGLDDRDADDDPRDDPRPELTRV